MRTIGLKFERFHIVKKIKIRKLKFIFSAKKKLKNLLLVFRYLFAETSIFRQKSLISLEMPINYK